MKRYFILVISCFVLLHVQEASARVEQLEFLLNQLFKSVASKNETSLSNYSAQEAQLAFLQGSGDLSLLEEKGHRLAATHLHEGRVQEAIWALEASGNFSQAEALSKII